MLFKTPFLFESKFALISFLRVTFAQYFFFFFFLQKYNLNKLASLKDSKGKVRYIDEAD